MASAEASIQLSPEQKRQEIEKFKIPLQLRRLLSYITLFFIGVFVVIGLPVWWRTTTTYRAWLPRSGIHALSAGHETNVVLSIRLLVLSMDNWLEVDQLAVFEQQLFDELTVSSIPRGENARQHGISINYHGLVRQCVGNELEILSTSTSLNDLENALVTSRTIAADRGGFYPGRQDGSIGGNYGDTYYFVLLPNTTRLLPKGPGLASTGVVRASSKVAYIKSTGDLTALRSLLVRLVNKVLVREPELRSAYQTTLSRPIPGPGNGNTGASSTPREKDRLRQMKPSATYDVTLTLVNSDPAKINATWDMREGLRLYLDPFLARLTRYISVSVKSQHLFCVNLEREGFPSTRRQGDTGSGYFYKAEILPHLLIALEQYLPNQVSNNPHMHLIVYIPPPARSPLYIHDARNQPVPTNAFLSHQWGGLLVYNTETPPAENSNTTAPPTQPQKVFINLQEVMQVFIPQLKVLLGLKRHVPRIILPLEEPDATGLTRWELDSWLRRVALENIASSTATLSSLVDLTDKVVNMVIHSDIAGEVIKSLEAIEIARHHLKTGNLQEAFISSKRALVAAETAFFDPSLLELLYFQDDQKYGIYMPLFIPVALPLVMSAYFSVKFLLSERQKSKVE